MTTEEAVCRDLNHVVTDKKWAGGWELQSDLVRSPLPDGVSVAQKGNSYP